MKRGNDSARAFGLQITLSIALISTSAILLAVAAPTHTKKASRQLTGAGKSSRVTAREIFTPASPTPTPICSKIVFDSSERVPEQTTQIFVMNSGGSGITQLTNTPEENYTPSFSRDGKKIAFSSERAGGSYNNFHIWVMNADGTNPTQVTHNIAGDGNPSFNGDGTKIAFASNAGRRYLSDTQIYVINTDGTNQTQLTFTYGIQGEFRESFPSFSPDGSKIAFASTRDGGDWQIYVMNADGSNQTRLTNNAARDQDPSWSPDGSKIVFSSNRDHPYPENGRFEIYVMNPDGSNQTRLTYTGAGNVLLHPTFNPDGSEIAFVLEGYQDLNGIYVVNADGSNQRRLTNGRDFDASFAAVSNRCPPVLIGLEVTQVVQDMDNSVPLVENKKTVVRAHLQDPSGSPTLLKATARLFIRDIATGGLTNRPPDNKGGRITVPQEPKRALLNDSFYFKLPKESATGTKEFTFLSDISFVCPGDKPGCDRVQVTFRPTSPLSIKFVPTSYKDGAGMNHRVSDDVVEFIKEQYESGYPVSSAGIESVVQRGSVKESLNPCFKNSFDEINKKLNTWRNNECRKGPCKDYYQALFADVGSCELPPNTTTLVTGLGDRPGHASSAFTSDSPMTRLHEQGHNLGFTHTKFSGDEVCTDGVGNVLPCTRLEGDGTLSLSKDQYAPATAYGFDAYDFSGTQIYPAETPDYMSYGRPRWFSKTNYTRLFILFEKFVLQAPGGARTTTTAMPEESVSQTVIIDGTVGLDGTTGQLDAVITDPAPATITLPAAGRYSLRFQDNQGSELARYSFEPNVGSGEENTTTGDFSLLLPWNPNARRIVLLYNEQILASRLASPAAPSVNVTFPNGGEVLSGESATFTWTAADTDGDPLRHTLEYSADNGSTWETLAVDWSDQSYPVDLSTLHGSNQALFRVTTSDGFNCTTAQSQSTFIVAAHVPNAFVSSPQDNRLYVGDQIITLEGSGFDVEEGRLGGTQLTWTSSLNGPLGSGESLSIDAMTLQEGTHTVTLTATDSSGQSGNASTTIRVFRERPVLPPALTAAPDSLSFRLVTGAMSSETIGIRNDGDGDLQWSATADQPWIHLEAGAGSTPHNLQLTADATGMEVGEYTGHVSIEASGADGSPKVVTVQLLVVTEPIPTMVAVSRKTHGGGGDFDVDLPLTGTPGIECRSGGETNDHTIIVTFAHAVTVTGNPQAQVTAGTATIGSGGTSNGGAVTVSSNVVTIPLTNVANAQTVTVTLQGVNDGTNTTNVGVRMGVLLGDVNGSGVVTTGDTNLCKSQLLQSLTQSNFRDDVNVTGSITTGDVNIIKQNALMRLP